MMGQGIAGGPGPGIGTLLVEDEVALIGNSELVIYIDANLGQYDSLQAWGTVTLGGSSTLSAVVTDGTPPPTAAYNVIWSGTGITGNFATLDVSGLLAAIVNDVGGVDYQLTPRRRRAGAR